METSNRDDAPYLSRSRGEFVRQCATVRPEMPDPITATFLIVRGGGGDDVDDVVESPTTTAMQDEAISNSLSMMFFIRKKKYEANVQSVNLMEDGFHLSTMKRWKVDGFSC
mmetsp:Transcript_13858/g.38302  ORF Transcript_13858/g.38302 Transcript_13858/m.38302 type:complete len:111 (-) Transcript_13858:138-470(-)